MKPILFIFIFLIFLGCNKDSDESNLPNKIDYREAYLGEFTFTTIRTVVSMCYNSSDTCINGWAKYTYKPTILKSLVEPVGTNKLNIKYGDGILGYYNNKPIIQTFTPEISSTGELSYPEYPSLSYNIFEGYYKGKDTIIINIQYGGGIGIYSKYEITGIRNK
jgi:hypothetical protein